jgi:hypothetical protein
MLFLVFAYFMDVASFSLGPLFYRWMFRRTLVADGNFTADHMKMRCPEEDVPLTHGYGYMVEEHRYKEHLGNTTELKEVPSSHLRH